MQMFQKAGDLLSLDEVVDFRLQAGHFLSAATKSNQKTPPPESAPTHHEKKKRDGRVPCAPQPERGPSTGHPWPDDGRFGILPRPAPTGAGQGRSGFAVLGADNGGQRQKHSNVKSQASLLLVSPPPVGGD
jgi:hypothetical protein